MADRFIFKKLGKKEIESEFSDIADIKEISNKNDCIDLVVDSDQIEKAMLKDSGTSINLDVKFFACTETGVLR